MKPGSSFIEKRCLPKTGTGQSLNVQVTVYFCHPERSEGSFIRRKDSSGCALRMTKPKDTFETFKDELLKLQALSHTKGLPYDRKEFC